MVASRPTHDMALLRLATPATAAPVVTGDSDAMEVGDEVFVVGAPLGESHTLTVGHVSARRTVRGLFFGTFAVASNTASEVLAAGQSVWSGLDGMQVTGGLAALLNVPPPGGGILVKSVATGSLAESLGLRPSTISPGPPASPNSKGREARAMRRTGSPARP